MIKTCRHDTVCPQPLGSQLIHFPAGGNGVAASHHPVIGGRCHNHPDPPYKTADKSGQVQAGGHHVDPLVGQAGQESARRGSAKPAGDLPAAGPRCWDLLQAASRRDGSLVGRGPRVLLQALGCLCPAPSLGGVRAASSPITHGRSEQGAPASASSSRDSEGKEGVERRRCRITPPVLEKQTRLLYSNANSLTIQNLALRQKN